MPKLQEGHPREKLEAQLVTFAGERDSGQEPEMPAGWYLPEWYLPPPRSGPAQAHQAPAWQEEVPPHECEATLQADDGTSLF